VCAAPRSRQAEALCGVRLLVATTHYRLSALSYS
jgi:hypothetical protein